MSFVGRFFAKVGLGVPVDSDIGDNASDFVHSSAFLNISSCMNSSLKVSLVIPTRLAALVNKNIQTF